MLAKGGGVLHYPLGGSFANQAGTYLLSFGAKAIGACYRLGSGPGCTVEMRCTCDCHARAQVRNFDWNTA